MNVRHPQDPRDHEPAAGRRTKGPAGRSSGLLALALVAAGLASGCVKYRPEPLDPARKARALENRTLDDPGLRVFMESNVHRELNPWPPPVWDLRLLALAAFYYHPDLDVARARWGVAKAGEITAGQRPNPSLGLLPTYSLDPGALSPWKLGLSLDIPIETAGKRGYRMAQAEALSEEARLDLASVAWRVRSRLRAGLVEVYAADRAVGIFKEQAALQEEYAGLLQERLAAGEVSQPEAAQARLALVQARLLLEEARKRKASAHVELAQALGITVAALDGVGLSFDEVEAIPRDLPPEEARAKALTNRTDVLASLAAYAAAEHALQLEVAKQYPDVHLGPGYTWDQGQRKWSLGLGFTLPLFNRNQGPIAEARARREEAAASFTALQFRAEGEVDRALFVFASAREALRHADALLAEQERRLRSVHALFDAGEADRLALVEVRLERAAIQHSRLEALTQAQAALTDLESALQVPLDGVAQPPAEASPRAQEGSTK